MPPTVDVTVTCLRTSSLNESEIFDPAALKKRWDLDEQPNCNVILAEPGKETGLHIPRVDMKISRALAERLDCPWGIDALGEPIIQALKRELRVNEVMFKYEIVD